MSRLFHAAAAALFLLSVSAGLAPQPDGPVGDPRSQLIALLGKSGLAYAGERPLSEGGAVLRFTSGACPSGIELVLLPELSRITPSALAHLDETSSRATFIHDGEVIGGLAPQDLMPRWAWRRLLVAVRLRAAEPWQSIALAMFVPRACRAPPVNWGSLTVTS